MYEMSLNRFSSNKSEKLFDFAKKYLSGGVSSSTRVNSAIGLPFYVSRGEGSMVYDLEGREYIDMCTSHGASLLGHNNAKVKEAILKALEMGIICAYENEQHSRLARKITEMVPCAELVRFTCSGTESTMHVIRLAREYTGKDKILRFEGHFHGYHDYVTIGGFPPADRVNSGVCFSPYIESGGVPSAMREFVIALPFNDTDVFEKTIKERKDEIAAVIMEPVNYNSGCIVPEKEYIQTIRKLTRENNVLLIFDEVLSGFRMCPGGAQEYLGIIPDLCTIGKAVAGGLPLSVFCGKREIMEHLRPLGNSEHSGTYNGNLIPVMAAQAALEEISKPGFYDHINQLANRFYEEFNRIFKRTGVIGHVQGLGARFGIFFGVAEEVRDYRLTLRHDRKMMLKFIKAAIEQGVYFHDYGGKACHHGFSSAHSMEDIDNSLDRIESAVKKIKHTGEE
jgi:glutamate-1-semialdehyde 2,1-aminomutase